MSWQIIIITGASRGFGQAIAISFAKASRGPLHFVLSGRTLQDLEVTKSAIESLRGHPLQTQIDIVSADLFDAAGLDTVASELFDREDKTREYKKTVFFNNAGSLGPLEVIDAYGLENTIKSHFFCLI